MATTAIKTTVDPEAAARVAELGMQKEFEEVLAHIKQTAPGLRWIDVALEYDPCEAGPPRVVLWAHRDEPEGEDRTDIEWAHWFVRTFPPDVCVHFTPLSSYEVADEG